MVKEKKKEEVAIQEGSKLRRILTSRNSVEVDFFLCARLHYNSNHIQHVLTTLGNGRDCQSPSGKGWTRFGKQGGGKAATMIYEDLRAIHEDVERLEQAIADRILDDPKHVSI